MEREGRIYEQVKHVLNDQEIGKLGEELARESAHINELREQKKTAVAAFNAQLKEVEGHQIALADSINQRFEWRTVEVVVLLDTPRPGVKAFARLEDPNDHIRYEPMTLEEKQQTFGFHLDDDDGGGGSVRD